MNVADVVVLLAAAGAQHPAERQRSRGRFGEAGQAARSRLTV